MSSRLFTQWALETDNNGDAFLSQWDEQEEYLISKTPLLKDLNPVEYGFPEITIGFAGHIQTPYISAFIRMERKDEAYIANPKTWKKGFTGFSPDYGNPLAGHCFIYKFSVEEFTLRDLLKGHKRNIYLFVWETDEHFVLETAIKWLKLRAPYFLISPPDTKSQFLTPPKIQAYYDSLSRSEQEELTISNHGLIYTRNIEQILHYNGIVAKMSTDIVNEEYVPAIVTAAYNISVAMYSPDFLGQAPPDWMKPF